MKKKMLAAAAATLAVAALGLSACGGGDVPGVPGVPGATASGSATSQAPTEAPTSQDTTVPTAPVQSSDTPTVAPTQVDPPQAGGALSAAQLEGAAAKIGAKHTGSKQLSAAQTTAKLQQAGATASSLDTSAVTPAECATAMKDTGMKVSPDAKAAGVQIMSDKSGGAVLLMSTGDPQMFQLMKNMYDKQFSACPSFSMTESGQTVKGKFSSFTPAGVTGDVVVGGNMEMSMPNGSLVQTIVIASQGNNAVSVTLMGQGGGSAVEQEASQLAVEALAAMK